MTGTKYVVSDERLGEIRSMFTVDGITLTIRGNVTLEDLAWALDDLLADRDERDLSVRKFALRVHP